MHVDLLCFAFDFAIFAIVFALEIAMNTYTRADFDHSPMIVFYETTRACDLACVHCRADAQHHCDPNELSTRDALRLVDELTTFPKPPLLVLTGGDPLKRADVFEIVEHARQAGLEVAMTPSATPLMTTKAIARLEQAGLHRLAVSLDGADAQTHDGFRRVAGSFDRTLKIIADANAIGLPEQIKKTVTRLNVDQIDAIADLLARQKIVLWSVFFLVPTGRGQSNQRLNAEECEAMFVKLRSHSQRQPYAIKTTEAPHYRRFIIQHARTEQSPSPARRMAGTNDGKGVMFLSHIGEIFPSGFLPICCGRFPLDRLRNVYQNSSLFRALRDADQLGGKCGVCEFKEICGGSRSRAFAVTGHPLDAEPDCAYVPPKWSRSNDHHTATRTLAI
jgi:radical SAM protein